MKRIVIPDPGPADIPFFLSVEEWAAQYLPADEYFFAWQVSPSIICGRHQEIDLEVDLGAAAREGVKVWRRKSGGGAVLADMNNVMFSYITPSGGVQVCFGSYTAMICRMLRSMGIPAEPTGRNDIAVHGRKVAGNAFLKLPGRSIVHGTMLYDSDFALMGRLLTPSRAKKESKGVKSVPSRVTTLRTEGIGISCGEFMTRAVDFLCPASNGEVVVDHNAMKKIMEIRESYLDPSHLNYHGAGRDSILRSAYIEGVGEIKFRYSPDSLGNIASATLGGDFFPLRDVATELVPRLIGIPPEKEALAQRLEGIDVGSIISGLTAVQLIETICTNE